jgi:PDZ domain
MMRRATILLAAAVFAPLLQAQPTPIDQPATATQKGSVVRVNSSNQAYDFFRPWSKKAPVNRRGLGTVIGDGKVLVTAELVGNSNFVELEIPESGAKSTATIDVIDYEANLATLKPSDPAFLSRLQPLEVIPDVRVGDRLSVLQIESNGALVSTQALVTTVEVGRYALEDAGYLIFRMSCPLQYRDNSFTVPVVKENRLAAILMRYDNRSQTVEAISSPVLAHFLKEALHPPYQGFPRAGIGFASTRDPQLRRYTKLGDNDGGVYVTQVEAGGPAARVGVQEGDVLLAIDDKPVDSDGNYNHPIFGKLSITHLTTTEAYSGQKVTLTLLRDGQRRQVPMELFRRPVEDYVIEPYTIGKPPKFMIVGGLVFQELTRQYLREWGTNWAKEAPQKFVYFDRFQSDLFPDKRKLVFLSQVMPTRDTVGYEQLNYLIVDKFNGQEIHSMGDLAKAVEKPLEGFHKIEFHDDPHEIFLDAKQVEEDAKELQRIYSLPTMQRL